MYSVTRSFGLNGLSGFAVAVEADISGGLPAFSIVGLPDSAVRESADRVRAAIKNLGFKFPDRRITINLAPADVRKTGPVYDLPLLLAVLTASGQLEDVPADAAFLGELALDGTLRPVSGELPMALAAAENGTHALYVPAENAAEAAEACADSMAVYPAHTAREVVDALRGISPLGMSPNAKALALYRDDALSLLRRMMASRDKALGEYMLTTHGVQAPAFRLQPMDSVALTSYAGRDRYTIALGLDGETIEIGDDTADAADAADSGDSTPVTIPADSTALPEPAQQK